MMVVLLPYLSMKREGMRKRRKKNAAHKDAHSTRCRRFFSAFSFSFPLPPLSYSFRILPRCLTSKTQCQ